MSSFANPGLFSKIGLSSINTCYAQLCEQANVNWCAMLVESVSHRSLVLFFISPGECVEYCCLLVSLGPKATVFGLTVFQFYFWNWKWGIKVLVIRESRPYQ